MVSNLLDAKGLNYGQLPKGLLLFHRAGETIRTAMEEHLAEGAMYAKNNAGEVNIHFTVSRISFQNHWSAHRKRLTETRTGS